MPADTQCLVKSKSIGSGISPLFDVARGCCESSNEGALRVRRGPGCSPGRPPGPDVLTTEVINAIFKTANPLARRWCPGQNVLTYRSKLTSSHVAEYCCCALGLSGRYVTKYLGPFGRKVIMTTHYLKYFMAAVMLAYVGGCARTFVPTLGDEFPPNTITEFSSKNPISLQNVQTDAEPVNFCPGALYFVANRQECTDVAIAIVRREMTMVAWQMVDNNARVMKFPVVSIKTEMGGGPATSSSIWQ